MQCDACKEHYLLKTGCLSFHMEISSFPSMPTVSRKLQNQKRPKFIKHLYKELNKNKLP